MLKRMTTPRSQSQPEGPADPPFAPSEGEEQNTPTPNEDAPERPNTSVITADPLSISGQTAPARINLREQFPISARLVLLESIECIIILVITVIGYFQLSIRYGGSYLSGPLQDANSFDVGSFIDTLYYLIVSICVAKILYELLNYILCRYAIELEHLTITRGLFFRSRSSFPVAKINDISLHRSPGQIILGLHTLTLLTAAPTGQYGSIEGLPSRSAYGLQTFLLSLLETTLPHMKDHEAGETLTAVADSVAPTPTTQENEQREA
jgi:membrane protein YdbS with pleckstrin-like domain